MRLFTLSILLYSLNVFSQGEYQSIFWEISGNGLKDTSYIYGTMHSQDSRIFQFKDGVEAAFNNSDIYAMELNIDSIDKSKMISELVMKNDRSLDKLLSKKHYLIVEKFFSDSLNMQLFIFNKIQPLYTAQLLTLKQMGNQEQDALDIYFFNLAKKQNKIALGLESMEEQLSAFSSIPYKLQAKELLDAVENYSNNDFGNLMNLYLEENLDKILTLQKSEDDDKLNKIIVKELLNNRNVNLANRSIPLIKKATTFIAIGAAHLPGEDGVIEILRKKGYTVNAR